MEWLETLQKYEIELIINIQNSLFKYEQVLGYFSTFFGSKFVYVFLIPCLAAFNTKLYHKTLISCIISDFANLVLKWILSGDRPYWWIHETNKYTVLTRPTLYQTERTCETSPGSPSGHMMIAASFLFVMLIATEKLIVANFMQYRRCLRYLARLVFAAILIVTALSRMYFATHFFHQCVLGVIIGISISETISFTRFTDKVQKLEKSSWLTTACIMSATVAVIYWMHKLINGNPLASVHLAFKYCSDPLYPKPETTLMFSSIRCISKVVGLLLAAPLARFTSPDMKLNRIRSIPVTILLVIVQWLFIVNTPRSFKILIFYAYTAVVYAIFQYLFLTVIPKFCARPIEKPKAN